MKGDVSRYSFQYSPSCSGYRKRMWTITTVVQLDLSYRGLFKCILLSYVLWCLRHWDMKNKQVEREMSARWPNKIFFNISPLNNNLAFNQKKKKMPLCIQVGDCGYLVQYKNEESLSEKTGQHSDVWLTHYGPHLTPGKQLCYLKNSAPTLIGFGSVSNAIIQGTLEESHPPVHRLMGIQILVLAEDPWLQLPICSPGIPRRRLN